MVEYGLSQTEQKVIEKAIRKNEVYAECHKSRLCDDRLGVKILIRHGISTTFTWIPSESQSLLESAKQRLGLSELPGGILRKSVGNGYEAYAVWPSTTPSHW